jgi:hypothetical protein
MYCNMFSIGITEAKLASDWKPGNFWLKLPEKLLKVYRNTEIKVGISESILEPKCTSQDQHFGFLWNIDSAIKRCWYFGFAA